MGASLKSGKAYEEVTLWRDALEVRHVSADGEERLNAFNPFWVRLHIDRDYEDSVTRLALRVRQQEQEIGVFLNPDDKASFAILFAQALHKVRA